MDVAKIEIFSIPSPIKKSFKESSNSHQRVVTESSKSHQRDISLDKLRYAKGIPHRVYNVCGLHIICILKDLASGAILLLFLASQVTSLS